MLVNGGNLSDKVVSKLLLIPKRSERLICFSGLADTRFVLGEQLEAAMTSSGRSTLYIS